MTLYDRLKDKVDFGFDVHEVEERYRVERDKRLRTDFEGQFIEVTLTSHAQYLVDDPHTPLVERDPITEEIEVLIIGGGWVGLTVGARLREAGHDNIRIIDGAGDFGGTWYWNRYPGAQCDIVSYVYLPLLEETGYVPKERYACAPEIFEHAQRIGKHYGLYDKAIFHTWITDMRWDEEAARWIVTTNRGDELRAQYVALGTGAASRPRLPGIPGLDDFTGSTFHTSRWDYDYTGGDETGGLVKLVDKRVAVIGTGATGIQVIPHVAEWSKETLVFQRTPSPVAPRGNGPTDPEWVASLQPGWQNELTREFDRVATGEGVAESEVLKVEGMLNMLTYVQTIMAELDPNEITPEVMEEIAELAKHMLMNEIRKRVDEVVTNDEYAEILKPWYQFMCKRPTFSDNYLPAFNRPNVKLIDVSAARGVERITEKGLVANGVEYEVDCIIFASGFEITSEFERRMGIPIYGRDGVSIYDHWRNGMRTFHGMMTSQFPNFFVMGGLFINALSPNYVSPIDAMAQHLVHVVDALTKADTRSVEPTLEAEQAFVARQREGVLSGIAINFGGAADSCTPGYYNAEGKPKTARRDPRTEVFPEGAHVYWNMLRDWREDGSLEGLDVKV